MMKREKICLIIALVMAVVITGLLIRERKGLIEVRAQEAQRELAEEVLRFHVLANSDDEKDQQLKMRVKEAVLIYMKKHLSENADLVRTKDWVQKNLEEIKAVAEQELRKEGSEYKAEVKLEKVMFPKKTYGDITFPAGAYQALRIEIGEAKGQNWWCCLYPNLCFIDAVHAVVPEEEKKELADVLADDSYEMITSKTDFKIKWFFFW